jgi:branched-chain amino acid transport system ATP-binding protein
MSDTARTREAPSPCAPAALELDHVDAGYRTALVLRNVSLRVCHGQVLALLGPNGAGKTTMLRTAVGILRPASGRVVLGGRDVTGQPPHERVNRGLCLVPEGRGVFKSLTVLDNLRLQAPAKGASLQETVERAVAVFPALKPRMNELAGRLSGGQQQMLALARAYVTKPEVILLDEVSMGLAPLIVDEMFRAFHDIADTGVAMILVEQYVNRALAMADTVVLLNKGAVAYSGPPSDLDERAVLQGYLGVEASETYDGRQDHY